jgi:hypothetical protein
MESTPHPTECRDSPGDLLCRGCLARKFDQFCDLTSKIDEGDPALMEGHVRNRGDDQASTRRGHPGDCSVEVNDKVGHS